MASFTSPTAALRTTSMALLFLLVLVLAPIARAAPAGFDYAALLRNGQEAQQLNALYPTLSTEDACTEAAKACVGDIPAQCTKGRWSLATTTCPDSQHCFALPSVRQSGTFIACTSEANALSIIAATGVEGGIAVAATESSSSTSIPLSSSSSSSATATGSGSHSAPVAPVVTKTMTLEPGSTMTLSPTTITMNAASASAVLSSLLAQGASIVSIIRPSASSSA